MKHHPDLRAAVDRAVARSRAGRRAATAHDLFAALLETPDVHLLIHQSGGDADVLAEALDSVTSALTAARRRVWFSMWLTPHPSFGRVIALASSHAKHRMQEELRPADVFAAGFDAGDAALIGLLERASLSRATVVQWLQGDPAAGVAAPAPEAPRGSGGFFRALGARLAWRIRPGDDVASSDGVIAACGIVALAVWLTYDRLAAGADAFWSPSGGAGIAWYGVGLLSLAYLLHKVSGALAAFRFLLAPLLGCLPLLVAGAVALQWVPEALRPAGVLLMAVAGLVHARRILQSVGASRPRTAILAAAAFCVFFAAGTEKAFIQPRLWSSQSADEDDDWSDTERLLFDQPDRIDTAAASVRAGDPGRPDVFFLGFAGTGEEKVFAEEAQLAERVITERYGAAGRSLLLVNDRRDLETRPLATVHGLRRALGRLAEHMDRSQDVLFLFITSHGSEDALSVSNTTLPLEQLEPAALREALDASGIRWRIVVISACYSGAFIPALSDDGTAIFTSAAADRTSFGCSDDRDLTEFGEAFLRDAVPGAPSLAAAFERAKGVLAAEERRRDLDQSLPQAQIGAAISRHWQHIEAQHAPGPAGSR